MEKILVIQIVVLLVIGVIIYFIIDYIMTKKIMKDSQDKIMNMLGKIYDTAELFIIGLFASIWGNDEDEDEDEDFK
jgi:heme/copper-type cytochrome/quinol oxidase subunit 2